MTQVIFLSHHAHLVPVAQIPKPILAQIGLEGTADLQVKNGVIEIHPLKRNPGPMALQFVEM